MLNWKEKYFKFKKIDVIMLLWVQDVNIKCKSDENALFSN